MHEWIETLNTEIIKIMVLVYTHLRNTLFQHQKQLAHVVAILHKSF
jgi:hypothetical protein